MPTIGYCKVCRHPRVSEINAELLSPNMGRRSLRAVASLFDLSHETIRRHFQKCLGQGPVKQQADTTQETDITPSQNIRIGQEQITKLLELNHRAQHCGNPVQMLVITRELLDLLANILKNNLS